MSARAKRIGRLSRLGTAVNLIVTVTLAVAVVVLVNWLSARPGVRQRFDLTATDKNTLSTASEGLLGRLEHDVVIEILYRPEQGPAMEIEANVMQRTAALAKLFVAESNGRITLEQIDTTDVEGWKQKQQRLNLRGFENGLLLTSGERVTFLRLAGDLARINPGQPSPSGFMPPTLAAFTAEEALVEGILDVTRQGELTAVFTSGAGEPGLEDEEAERELGQLAAALRAEGFTLQTWNQSTDGALPEGTDVLVIVAPKGPWPAEMYASIVDWTDRGGRLVIAPAFDPDELRASDVPDLVDHLGLTVSEGRVCNLVMDPRTGRPVDGLADNEFLNVPPDAPSMVRHPITEPFFDVGRGLIFSFVHAVGVRQQPAAGVAQRLARSHPSSSWIDAPPMDRRLDPSTDTTADGQRGFGLLVTLQAVPFVDVPEPAGLEAEPEIRVVLFGSEAVLWNQSVRFGAMVLPSFNWTVEREHRISVPARDPDLRVLPREDPTALPTVTRFAQLWFPGALVLVGVLVWIVRARGSRRAARPEPTRN